MREAVIEDYLTQRVEKKGGEVRKVRWVGRRGAPDRLVMLPGFCLYVEVKAPGEVLQDHQEREIKTMRRYGIRVEVIDSHDKIDDLISEYIDFIINCDMEAFMDDNLIAKNWRE